MNQPKNFDFDVIVIGSGFGGSVMSLRLTEKGHKVCLLERGQDWPMFSFPRRVDELENKLPWSPSDNKFGFMEIRDYPGSDVMSVTASGLGGGSLIYANVMLRMPAENFAGWPGGISRTVLDPYYDKVKDVLEASPYPFGKEEYYTDTPKTAALARLAESLPAAQEMGATAKPEFLLPDLAIRFQGNFPGHQSTNKHGALQSKCIKCGECDIGCNIHAKNTLNLNYLFCAKNITGKNQTPLEIRTHAEVVEIKDLSSADQTAFQVTYQNPTKPSEKTTLTTKKIVLAAGSIHSTELLLRMKKKSLLPHLSPMLGKNWCGNGDLEGMSIESDTNLDPTNGPVITGAIRYKYQPYPDGFADDLYIQDAGAPIGLDWYLSGKIPSPRSFLHIIKVIAHFVTDGLQHLCGIIFDRNEKVNIGADMLSALDKNSRTRKLFIMLGMGRDRSTGEITLGSNDEALVKWSLEPSRLHYDRALFEMKRLAQKLGGIFAPNPLMEIDKIVAVHPLGGCIMGENQESGVVNTQGEAFGHKGLYVVDGSIIPTSIGPNPSMTIAALAEMIADRFEL